MSTQLVGAPVKRREDPRLITGGARYAGDLTLPGMAHMAFVRSPHAHAAIKGINIEDALKLPGVVAIFLAKDTPQVRVPTDWYEPDSERVPHRTLLAGDKVCHVGDALALVVAEDPYTAQDAVDRIVVDYEPLLSVLDVELAAQENAPKIHSDLVDNIANHNARGSERQQVDRIFENAEIVVSERVVQQRVFPSPMEPRAALAQWNAATEEMTLWCSTQAAHIQRSMTSRVLDLPEHRLRVITPEVGGGFGCKIPFYIEETLVCWAARKLNRPVRWVETRAENFQATTHGRGHVALGEIAATYDGLVQGLRATIYSDFGAYPDGGAGAAVWGHSVMLSNVYAIPVVRSEAVGVYTNKTPIGAYRGAGRPEGVFLVERLMDRLAAELSMDPVELRQKNLIPPFDSGYKTATRVTYDSGNYQDALDKALDLVNYQDLRRLQAVQRQQGKLAGIGVAIYTETCASGWDSATVRVTPYGKVQVMTGVSPHGQGTQTSFMQIVGDELGIPIDDIEVIYGDTDRTSMGWGTMGSRGTPIGSLPLLKAANDVREKARVLAAHLLEAAVEDVDFEAGQFFVKGTPSVVKTIQEIAMAATLASNIPPGVDPNLEATHSVKAERINSPFGVHIAIVEIDAETGEVRLNRYAAVNDCGPQINPMLVAGQIHGGVVQGIGQVLTEGVIYDEYGQLLTGTFMDYALPRADLLPEFELDSTFTPSPNHPLGVKGAGEAGTIGAIPAVYSAVLDALKPFGVNTLEMPLTAAKIWAALQSANEGG